MHCLNRGAIYVDYLIVLIVTGGRNEKTNPIVFSQKRRHSGVRCTIRSAGCRSRVSGM